MAAADSGAQGEKSIRWNAIYAALEKWRAGLGAAPMPNKSRPRRAGGEVNRTPSHGDNTNTNASPREPSVTTVAEIYRHNPWAVLASTIISLRTKDEVTMEASKRLLEKAPGPRELAALREDTIARLIYPAGFYRTKAASLKKIAAILIEQYGEKVPADMDALLALPGVGRKTANLVLIEAFDLPAICVDIHVHRISNRAGWLRSKAPDETEMILREILPRQYWKGINALLVLYGQNLCRPVSPWCSRCVISKWCERAGVTTTR